LILTRSEFRIISMADAMTHEEAAFEAIAFRRNVGVTFHEVHTNVRYRTKDKDKKRTQQILETLEADNDLVRVGDKWFLTSSGYKRAKGSPLRAEWQQPDAWIFLSILQTCSPGGETDLRRIIGAADYMNHAIPTREELHGAINRLRSAQLIRIKRGKLSVTSRAEELMKKVEATSRRAMLSQAKGLRRLMDCPCCGVELKVVRWGYELDAQAYDEVVKAYRASF
jgi:hypothetical protein